MNHGGAVFEWHRQPEAEAYIHRLLEQFAAVLSPVRALESDLMTRTSSRLVDWLDHLVLAGGDTVEAGLREFGFEPENVPAGADETVFYHPGAIFPRLVQRRTAQAEPGTPLLVAIQVDDVADFMMAHQVEASVEGSILSPYRRARVWEAAGRELWVVERRGHRGFVPTQMAPDYPAQYLKAFESWATRPRNVDDTGRGMERALELARSLVADLSTDSAAWVAFSAERSLWQQRNWAGQVQKSRQDSLGLGWANHDHHTFRSSREHFSILIQILETFGFRARERFYAGAEAGWGAQVMEQPVCRFAVFADVDLSPDEADGDFAHQGLAPRQDLGTVGLWCALHGESMLSAGLHHLAGRFSFDVATAALAERGVSMMHPFSDFPYLKQAFTRGERWPVNEERLERLMAAGQITRKQRERFAADGAVGSHLENIQRGEGFKGFNQQTVSDIIRRTDPRHEHDSG
jgi:hypothetical protein